VPGLPAVGRAGDGRWRRARPGAEGAAHQGAR
jgi:hypothetical protein